MRSLRDVEKLDLARLWTEKNWIGLVQASHRILTDILPGGIAELIFLYYGHPDPKSLWLSGHIRRLGWTLRYGLDTEIRRQAAEYLGDMNDGRTVDLLIPALIDLSPYVQSEAIASLGRKQWKPKSDSEQAMLAIAEQRWDEAAALGEVAVGPLTVMLNSTESRIRNASIETLGRLPSDEVVENLTRVLYDLDRSDEVRLAATSALGQCGTIAVETLIGALNIQEAIIHDKTVRVLSTLGDCAMPALAETALNGDKRRVRQAAMVVLQQSGPDVLLRACQHRRTDVRQVAITALGALGDTAAAGSLVKALQDDERTVRRAAAESLGKLHDSLAVEPLIDVLRDQDHVVRAYAVKSLGMLGDEKAVDPLIMILNRDAEGEDNTVREQAILSLGALRSERVINPLIQALRDPIWAVRNEAAGQLALFGDRAIDPLREALEDRDPDLRKTAVKILGKIDSDRLEDVLAPALQDHDSDVRREAVKLLRKLDAEPAVMHLIHVLGDEDPEVIEEAQNSIAALGGCAVGSLLELWHNEKIDIRLRRSVEHALSRLGIDPRKGSQDAVMVSGGSFL